MFIERTDIIFTEDKRKEVIEDIEKGEEDKRDDEVKKMVVMIVVLFIFSTIPVVNVSSDGSDSWEFDFKVQGGGWEVNFTESFPNGDDDWQGDDEGDTHQNEYWFVSDVVDTADIAVDSTNEGTISVQPNPPALHLEDFDDVTQWVEARADAGLNYWNPSSIGWTEGFINFTYAWYCDNNEGIQFWTWNGTSAEIQWSEYAGGNNQEHEWDTYSWALPQWVLDETEFAFRFEMKGNADTDEVYVDNVTLEVNSVTPASNTIPTQSNQYVWDGIDEDINHSCVDISPVCFNVTISDADGHCMNVTTLTNESGSWEIVNQTTSCQNNGTYSFYNTSWVDSYNTRYYISFNVSDDEDWNNQTFYFTTKTAPTVEVFHPINNSADVRHTPICQVWANDSCGRNVDVYFSENSTGSWIVRQSNLSVTANSTVYWKYNQANKDLVVYYWRVNISGSPNETFIFNFQSNGFLVYSTLDFSGKLEVEELPAFTTYSTLNFSGKVEAQGGIDIDISPISWDANNPDCGEWTMLNFTFYQNSSGTIDILIGFNETNYTFVNFTLWNSSSQYNYYCANVTNDTWTTEWMIEPKVAGEPVTYLNESVPGTSNFVFGVRIWMPKYVNVSGLKEDFEIYTTASIS